MAGIHNMMAGHWLGGFPTSATFLGSTIDTNAGAVTVAATPQVGHLLVVMVRFNGPVAGAVTDDQSGTYTKIGGIGSGGWYVRDTFVSSAVSHTVTCTPNTASNGRAMVVLAVSGMAKAGIDGVGANTTSTFAAGGTPSCTTGVPPLNAPVFGWMWNATNPAGVTPRTEYTEHVDSGYGVPTFGCQVMSINGGETGSAITWGGTSATAGTCGALVLDSGPTYVVTRAYSSGSAATETAPEGATNVVIEIWGGGAGGPRGIGTGCSADWQDNGSSGGYSRTDVAITGGQTLTYTVGARGLGRTASAGTSGTASSVSSGTKSITTMTADGGTYTNTGSGAPGGASGGANINTTGNIGTYTGGGGETPSPSGTYYNTAGVTAGYGGISGYSSTGNGGSGGSGYVVFKYT